VGGPMKSLAQFRGLSAYFLPKSTTRGCQLRLPCR
jgi:hypothetical protein